MQQKPKKVRVQIDMSEAAYGRLERLQEVTDAPSIAQVIREAIELREAVAGLLNDGYEIVAENEETGKRKSLYLPAMRD
jgi:hypothetical protein